MALIIIILLISSGCYYKWYYALNITYDPVEGGIVNETGDKNPENGKYAKHSNVILEAVPNPGWNFLNWSGDLTEDENPASVQIEDDTNVTANFGRNEYTLTASVTGEGTVTIDPSKEKYEYEETVELTASPTIGWEFSGWAGDITSDSSVIQIDILENTNVTAIFEKTEYYLSIETTGEGTVSISPNEPYYYNYVVQLTAQASPGWKFDEWTGDLSGNDPSEEIIMNEDKNITANFEVEKYTLTIGVIGEGEVQRDPEKDEYEYGEYVELTPEASAGWEFLRWTGDQSGDTYPIIIKMNKDKDITATFEEIPVI
jgi:hypothetical protein